MDRSSRQFVWKVLGSHVLLLAALVAAVGYAAREFYQQSRVDLLNQLRQRQKLLATQAASGIERQYGLILRDLDLIARGQEWADQVQGDAPLVIANLLWHQLEGRVSILMGVLRPDMQLLDALPGQRRKDAAEAMASARSWLSAVRGPSVGPPILFRSEWVQWVCVPAPATPNTPRGEEGHEPLVAAMMPLAGIEGAFLETVNRENSMGAALLDESGVLHAAHNKRAVGKSVLTDGNDPIIRHMAGRYLGKGVAGTEIVEESVEVAGVNLPPRLLTIEPVRVAGRNWAVVIGSNLSEVDGVLGNVYRKAVIGAGGMVLSITAVLVSTALQLIRSRVRMERLRAELLEREVAQARQIQLAWLPKSGAELQGIEVAAVNEPASKISGDFYDWFELSDGRSVVSIGDVTGHGTGAAFLMATTQLLIRASIKQLGDPGRALEEVNRLLCGQPGDSQFVTVLLMVFDPRRGTIEAASAGHFAPLACAGGEVRSLEMDGGLMLGITPDESYPTETFSMESDESWVMYTDGVVDALSPTEDRFDGQRLCNAIGVADSADGLLRRLQGQVDAFREGRELVDDLTLVVVRRTSFAAKAMAPVAVG